MNNLNHTCYTLSRNSNRCDVCGARLPRLIDANALEEHKFADIRFTQTDYQQGWNDAIDAIIDNAPTVDTTFREVVAYECGQKSVDERPKGKWIEVDNGLVSGRCSLCGWEAVIMETDVCGMPFCPNCGADMRGDV